MVSVNRHTYVFHVNQLKAKWPENIFKLTIHTEEVIHLQRTVLYFYMTFLSINCSEGTFLNDA